MRRMMLTGLAAAVAIICAVLPAEAQQPEVEIEVREAEQSMRMQERALRDAERELQEAARRVAELSRGAAPEVIVRAERMARIGRGPRLGLGLSTEVIDGEPVDDGVKVQSVSPGSAAAESGIKAGDLLVGIEGTSLRDKSASDAVEIIGGKLKDKKAGDNVKLAIEREGKASDYTLTLNDRSFSPAPMVIAGDENMVIEIERMHEMANDFEFHERRFPRAPGAPPVPGGANFLFISSDSSWANMELVELSPRLGEYFNADSGLLIVRAPQDNELGFEDGDVIRSIDGRTPEDVGHAMRILRSYESGEQLKVEILRDRKKKRLSIKVPEKVGRHTGESLFEWHSAPSGDTVHEEMVVQ